MPSGELRHVAITGSNGVLGQRLAQHLLSCRRWRLLLLDDFTGFYKGIRRDPRPPGADVLGDFEEVQADFCEWGRWVEALAGADAVVHFAACNPYPEASWEDSRRSMRMSANVVAAAQRAGVRRLVVASSSHVLGGYLQDGPELAEAAPRLRPETPLRHFTRFRLPGLETDASGYSSAKVALEEMARAASLATPGLSAVVVRIGWCQPGANRPQDMSATATPTVSGSVLGQRGSSADDVARGFDDRDAILGWLHRIWLSTRDFHQLFERAIEADVNGCLTVFGVSCNSGMRWSCEEEWSKLRYEPADDAMCVLCRAAGDEEHSSDAKRRKID